MSNAYQSPYVSITLSLGTRQGNLAERLKQAASDIFNCGADVTTLKAKADDDSDVLNLIKELVDFSGEVDLEGDISPEDSYNIRKNFLQRAFNEHREYLVNLYSE